MKIVYYDYKVGKNIMLMNKSPYKYETPYRRPYEIT